MRHQWSVCREGHEGQQRVEWCRGKFDDKIHDLQYHSYFREMRHELRLRVECWREALRSQRGSKHGGHDGEWADGKKHRLRWSCFFSRLRCQFRLRVGCGAQRLHAQRGKGFGGYHGRRQVERCHGSHPAEGHHVPGSGPINLHQPLLIGRVVDILRSLAASLVFIDLCGISCAPDPIAWGRQLASVRVYSPCVSPLLEQPQLADVALFRYVVISADFVIANSLQLRTTPSFEFNACFRQYRLANWPVAQFI